MSGMAAPVTRQAVSPTTGSLLITCEYNPVGWGDASVVPGLAWCIMHDNPVLSWLVDTTGGAPIMPVILGTLPDWTPPDTAPVLSPRWAVRETHEIFIPDMWRGEPREFFDFIAYNNGAQRPIYAKFADTNQTIAWNVWKQANPRFALSEPPNL